MRAADVMETRVAVADARTDAEEAWDHMRTHALEALVVTDRDHIVGVVTRARLDGGRGKGHRRDRTLAEYLPRGPVAVTSDCSVARALTVLDGQATGCVPVLERGRLVGVLTIAGLLRRLDQRQAARRRAS